MRLLVAEEPLQGLHILLCDVVQAPKSLLLLYLVHLVEVRGLGARRCPKWRPERVLQGQAGVLVCLDFLRKIEALPSWLLVGPLFQ